MRLNADQTVIVETLADIKHVITEFIPGCESKNPDISVVMSVDNITYKLSAPTNCSYKDMLNDGFEIIKRRLDAKNKNLDKISLGIDPISAEGHMWLDDLIVRRLGGVRDGLRIKWQLKEGTFFFDPFTGKLTESQNA